MNKKNFFFLFIVIFLNFFNFSYSQDNKALNDFLETEKTKKKKAKKYAIYVGYGVNFVEFDELNNLLKSNNFPSITTPLNSINTAFCFGNHRRNKPFLIIESKMTQFDSENLATKQEINLTISEIVFSYNYTFLNLDPSFFSTSIGLGMNTNSLKLIDNTTPIGTFGNSLQNLTGEKYLSSANFLLHFNLDYDIVINLFSWQKDLFLGLNFAYALQLIETEWAEKSYLLEQSPKINVGGIKLNIKLGFFF